MFSCVVIQVDMSIISRDIKSFCYSLTLFLHPCTTKVKRCYDILNINAEILAFLKNF